MKKKYKFGIISGSVLFLVLAVPNLMIWMYFPSIEISGTIDYTGLPPPPQDPMHGFRYHFYPEENELYKLSEVKLDRISLVGDSLYPELDEKKVRISGLLVDDVEVYNSLKFQLTLFGPRIAIAVNEIEILN